MLSGQEASRKPRVNRNATAGLPLELPSRVPAALSSRDTRQPFKSLGRTNGGESGPRDWEASGASCPPQSLLISGLMPGCCERSVLSCWISKPGTAQTYRKRIFARRRWWWLPCANTAGAVAMATTNGNCGKAVMMILPSGAPTPRQGGIKPVRGAGRAVHRGDGRAQSTRPSTAWCDD
jgi:hypothetical protein